MHTVTIMLGIPCLGEFRWGHPNSQEEPESVSELEQVVALDFLGVPPYCGQPRSVTWARQTDGLQVNVAVCSMTPPPISGNECPWATRGFDESAVLVFDGEVRPAQEGDLCEMRPVPQDFTEVFRVGVGEEFKVLLPEHDWLPLGGMAHHLHGLVYPCPPTSMTLPYWASQAPSSGSGESLTKTRSPRREGRHRGNATHRDVGFGPGTFRR